MMDSIVSSAMEMKAEQFAVQYSMAVTKKVMDTPEMAAQELLEMLPAVQNPGQYIDTYA